MSSRLQQKLSNEFLKHYPTAQVKKLGADNFVDIHLPFVHDKRGTHLFFNTSGGKIKLGFYCRDEEFTTRVLSNSTQLEAYSQGVRLVGNPAFNTVEDAVKAAQVLVTALGAPAPTDKETPTHQADKSAVTTLANQMVRLLNSPEYKWLRPEGVNEVSDGGSSVRLHICTVSGIFRQFQVREKMIHAEYYFNPERIDVYDHLVRVLNADTNHIFANGSYGNGPSKGSSRTIKLTLDQGANMVAEKGEQLAKEAIESFISLIDYIEPSIPDDLKGWSQRHSGTPSQNPLATAAKPSAVETEAPSLDVDTNDQEEEDSRGYPMLLVPRSETVPQEVVTNYLMRWQVPSVEYAWRAGVKCFFPDWVEKLTLNEICPLFTNEQLTSIASRVEKDKVIPLLSYAPEELFEEMKQVWWIVPFCIWKDDVASVVVVDKNGLHAMYKDDDEIIFNQIFSWEHVYNVEYESGDDPNVCRLTLYMEDSNRYLTFDEFVSNDSKRNQGSYLAVLYAIWSVRAKTIEVSRGQPVWYEGAGGEGFKTMPTPYSLLDPNAWLDPYRPAPSDFGFDENDQAEDDLGDSESNSQRTNDRKGVNASEFSIPETLAFLYIACAGADGTLSTEEKEVLVKELNGWSQTGQLLPTQRIVELFDLWVNLSVTDESNLVITLAEQLKQKFDDQKLKTVFADLIKIADALEGVGEQEKKYLLTLAKIWQLG